jgi:hypothetical protein
MATEMAGAVAVCPSLAPITATAWPSTMLALTALLSWSVKRSTPSASVSSVIATVTSLTTSLGAKVRLPLSGSRSPVKSLPAVVVAPSTV